MWAKVMPRGSRNSSGKLSREWSSLPRDSAQNDPASSSFLRLLQFGVFRLGLLKNRDVGVGVLPERQEILVSSLCLGLIAQQSESSAQLQMRQSAHRIGANN